VELGLEQEQEQELELELELELVAIEVGLLSAFSSLSSASRPSPGVVEANSDVFADVCHATEVSSTAPLRPPCVS
jgi:hypothetical protein